MGSVGSVGWCVDRGVGNVIHISDGITFDVDDGYYMGFYYELFDRLNHEKLWVCC